MLEDILATEDERAGDPLSLLDELGR
jgi:hypothetical protein